jgi:methanogenic corrinoid protein MtbC1
MPADTFTLRQVVELTGLSEFTLRGWENRYSAFEPERTKTGRREYSSSDLQRALLLRELIKRRHRIGSIAKLPTRKLEELLREGEVSTNPAEESLSLEVREILRNLALQEWDQLEEIFASLAKKKDIASVVREVILPVISEVGALVARGQVTVAQEHVLSSFIKECLFRLRYGARRRSGKARVVIAAPEGDYHEIGILAAHTLAAAHGVRSLYVGANSPRGDLAETVLRYGATHLLLGSTVSRREGAKEDLHALLSFLDRQLPPSLALWIGGRNAAQFRASLARPLAIFGSLLELDGALSELGQ